MEDRELIELSAKAAGFNFRWFRVKQWKNMKGKIGPYRYLTGTVDVYGSHHTKPWNPLTDDGDALRLAVSLNIHIRLWVYACEAQWECESTGLIHASDCGGDVCAATRRAITMMAAKIVKEMK